MFNRLQPQPVNARRRGHVRQPEDRTSPGIACGRLFVLPLARRDGWPGAAVRLEDAHGGGCKFLRFICGPNWTRLEATPTIRTAPAQLRLRTGSAEGAFKTADHRIAGLSWKILVAAFAIGSKL